MTLIRSVLMGVALTTAACAPVVKMAGPAVNPPTMDGNAIVTADAQHLPLRSWLPAGEPSAVILGIHGFNDYGNAFALPGAALAEDGIAVYALDLRGFGAAPDHGYWVGTDVLVDDIGTAARLLAARHPGKPLYLMGESMGGALAMVTMTRPHPPAVQGIILAAPAVWNRASMNVFERGALWIASHTTPWMTLTGRGLDITPSDNIEMLRALGRDPLVIKETRVDAVHGLCDLMDEAAAVAPRLTTPTLLLYGEKDQIVPAAPTYQMMKSVPGSPVEGIYPNGYHMLLRDRQAKVVLNDIESWIAHPGQPLPSGADARARTILDGRVATAAKEP